MGPGSELSFTVFKVQAKLTKTNSNKCNLHILRMFTHKCVTFSLKLTAFTCDVIGNVFFDL